MDYLIEELLNRPAVLYIYNDGENREKLQNEKCV